MTLVRAPELAPMVVHPKLWLRAESGLGIGKLALRGGDPAAQFRRIAGFDPPVAGRQFERQGMTWAWLAPGEWLIAAPERLLADAVAHLSASGGDEVLAVDLTHGRSCLLLSGGAARDVLASLCPLDLWEGAFPIHAVARSLLGATGMFIARLADGTDGPRFRIIVDQTMEDYAVRMLAGSKPRPGNQA